jgi:TRAP-type transport system small permease protein
MQSGLRLIDHLSVWLAIGAGVVLTALALFTFADVIMRYVFNAPIVGSIDIIELMLVVVVSLALPYAGRSQGHIVVDLVPDYRSALATRARDALGRLLPAVIFALLAWQAWLRGDDAAMMGEASNMLEIPFQPFFYVLAAGSAVYAIALLFEFALLATGRRIDPVRVGVEDELPPAE